MIARLSGQLVRKSPEVLIVDVHGVGFRVLASLNAFSKLPAAGEPVTLETYTHVRDNGIELFGFVDSAEKGLFHALISVAGVGPRMALNILSGMRPEALREALVAGDVRSLVSVPGIGKKTAERLVVELKDRLANESARGQRPGRSSDLARQAVSALMNLGYKERDAERAVAAAGGADGGDVAELIRTALQGLSGG